ncbi:unnamed protein product [marine sediment metagenome]|uniref:Uncharacterized protein n=1 Tax=marine sediment metagenome TaxID=412755 RepID=X1JHV7_9ZZZZ
MSTEIDELTDEEIDELVASEELKCKIEPRTQRLVCATSEDISRAIGRLRKPVKQLLFEVTTTEPPTEPVTQS